jgi:hypothetical protein
MSPGSFDAPGDSEKLLFTLHGARTSDVNRFVAADGDITYPDDPSLHFLADVSGILTAYQPVRNVHPGGFFYSGKNGQMGKRHLVLVAHEVYYSFITPRDIGFQAVPGRLPDNVGYFLIGGSRLHDNHFAISLYLL